MQKLKITAFGFLIQKYNFPVARATSATTDSSRLENA